jgi:hypothetical protein
MEMLVSIVAALDSGGDAPGAADGANDVASVLTASEEWPELDVGGRRIRRKESEILDALQDCISRCG